MAVVAEAGNRMSYRQFISLIEELNDYAERAGLGSYYFPRFWGSFRDRLIADYRDSPPVISSSSLRRRTTGSNGAGERKTRGANVSGNRDMAMAMQMQLNEEEDRQMADRLRNEPSLRRRTTGSNGAGERKTRRRTTGSNGAGERKTRRRSRTRTPPPTSSRPSARGTRRNGRRNRIPAMMNTPLSRFYSAINPLNAFPAIWRVFACKSRGRSGSCALPERIEDLPPVMIEEGTEGFPYKSDVIPGTTYTYEQLNQAMQLTPAAHGHATDTGCMAVHKVMDHMQNPLLVYEIISSYAQNNPRWNDFSGSATIEDIRDMFSRMLREFVKYSNGLYRRRGSGTDVVGVSVDLVSEALAQGTTITIGKDDTRLEIDPATFVIMLLLFIGELPPQMQTAWAEEYLKDNIEAYIRDGHGNRDPNGCSFEEWPRSYSGGATCNVSCARGAIERIFLGLSSEFVKLKHTRIDENALRQHTDFAAREAARKVAEDKARSNAELAAAKKAMETQKRGPMERKRLVNVRAMAAILQSDWGSADPIEVRNHILAEADKEPEFHNTHNEWDASMKEYFNEVGGDPPDLQGMIGIKANEGNKWENISKRNNEVKEGGRRKKRKKTRKGKKKKKRKKTRKK
jgi:hypothetical protein